MKTRVGSDGVHVFDRGSGLNILLDDVAPPPELWSPAPRYVSVALTNACDLKCPFCYAPKVPAAVPVQRLKQWLRDLDEGGCLGVGFGGGEPTLAPEFVELCQWVSGHTRMAVSFTTHGHHITPAMPNALRGSVHFVRVSMDGVGQTYEHFRGRPFSRFVHQLAHVAEIAPFGLNYVVNAQTFPDLDAALALACEVGASELLLLPEQPTGTRAGVDPEISQALEDWVNTRQGRIRLAISQAGLSDGIPGADPFPGQSPFEAHVHVDAMGVLKRSSFEPRGQVIGDAPIFDALRSLRAQGGHGW